MYEYIIETIQVNTLGGEIGGRLIAAINKRAEQEWRLVETITQYTRTGTNYHIYLVFERIRKTRLLNRLRKS